MSRNLVGIGICTLDISFANTKSNVASSSSFVEATCLQLVLEAILQRKCLSTAF